MPLSTYPGGSFPFDSGPAIDVYRTTNQTSVASTNTVVFTVEEFDTHNCYNTGDGTFTPNKAGLYYCKWYITKGSAGTANEWWASYVAKNGAGVTRGKTHVSPSANVGTPWPDSQGSGLVSVNGTTDYISIKYYGSATTTIYGSAFNCRFQAAYIGPEAS